LVFTGCKTPSMMVYSSGFSFVNYDYVVVGKSEGKESSTALYGMDVEFANLMSRYNMKVIGNKEYLTLPLDVQKRTMEARISLSASDSRVLLAVSFDDAVTGRTGCSITSYTKGNIFDTKVRTSAFEEASATIIKALEKDRGLTITKEK
jgi:hypothetical protein